MRIAADKNIPYLNGIVEQFGDVRYLTGADFVQKNIKDVDVLIVRTVARLDEYVLGGTNVKLICSATIGYDHIDTAYCDSHGITWYNAPGSNSSSVQQYIVSALIVLSRQNKINLKDKIIGIVGVGNVGEKVAKACEILGLKVLLNDPPREAEEGSSIFVDMDTIKREADIITFHTPLKKEGIYKTYHMADAAFFSSLSKKPVIINSARGGVVETEAIKYALSEGLISGAVIDCWENEPDIDREYMSMVNIATPHIAGYSADGKANASRISLENIATFYHMGRTPIDQIKIPEPQNPVIDLDNFSGNRIEEAILTTYNPINDFEKLKNNPGKFKDLRNEYPLRREYPSYIIRKATDTEEIILKELGFKF